MLYVNDGFGTGYAKPPGAGYSNWVSRTKYAGASAGIKTFNIATSLSWDTLYSFRVLVNGVVDPTCVASHSGSILGDRNPSEPYSCFCQADVAKPVNTESGNFWHTFSDFALGGRGPTVGLNRTYNSMAAATNG
ncbi:MAG: hypothetical protein Q8K63_07045, partial [Acidimicrobiales bacterium]|nr:hypothetical protein [Acidimicrobiales bacterium]